MHECFEVLMFMAAKNLQLALFEKGELYAKTALALFPQNHKARVLLAYAQLLNRQFHESIQSLEGMEEDIKNVHYIRARANMLLQDLPASRDHWSKYVGAEE